MRATLHPFGIVGSPKPSWPSRSPAAVAISKPASGVDRSIARVRAWLAQKDITNVEFARQAGLGEKHLRMARLDDWNPTADILRKLDSVIPPDWQPGDPIPPATTDTKAAA